MGRVLPGFDGIGPSSRGFVVEYASMSFLLNLANLSQSRQTGTMTLLLNRP